MTGLSGAGKTSIANELEILLFSKNIQSYILDGDNTRMGISADLDFSDTSRIENIRRIASVSKLMNDAGLVVITSLISPFEQNRELAKKIIGDENFVLVYVKCDLETCEKRDVKGLYKKARNGEIKNFTGIDSDFEVPKHPDIIIDTKNNTIDDSVRQIYNYIKAKLKLN
jgi:adenylylsulfate kinase